MFERVGEFWLPSYSEVSLPRSIFLPGVFQAVCDLMLEFLLTLGRGISKHVFKKKWFV